MNCCSESIKKKFKEVLNVVMSWVSSKCKKSNFWWDRMIPYIYSTWNNIYIYIYIYIYMNIYIYREREREKQRETVMSQKFCNIFVNMRYNSATLGVFAEALKMTNQTGVCDAELTWCSPTVTRRICFNGLELNLPDSGSSSNLREIYSTIWLLCISAISNLLSLIHIHRFRVIKEVDYIFNVASFLCYTTLTAGEDKVGGSIRLGYLSESERNHPTGVWTRLLRGRCPTLYLLLSGKSVSSIT